MPPPGDPPRVWIDEYPTPDDVVQGRRYRPTGTVTPVTTSPAPDRPTGRAADVVTVAVVLDILGVLLILVGVIGCGVMIYRISPDLLWAMVFAATTGGGVLLTMRRT